ncbi:hypothetical protein PRIPAC_94946 [Pristionchus pacificus]|nr:hypothetical protein PRIPAC_94946 [Pristionchus pacificus]
MIKSHSNHCAFGSIAALLFMALDLAAIYLTFELLRSLSPVLITVLYCLFLIFVYLRNPLRDATPNSANFISIIGSFVAAFFAMFLQVPLFETNNLLNATFPEVAFLPEQKGKALEETAWFAFPAFLLLLYYFIRTALLNVDIRTKEAAAAAAVRLAAAIARYRQYRKQRDVMPSLKLCPTTPTVPPTDPAQY